MIAQTVFLMLRSLCTSKLSDADAAPPCSAADQSTTAITVDGASQCFLLLAAASGRWVAVGQHENLVITVAAREIAPEAIVLESLEDPAARLLGPEPPQPVDPAV